MYKSGIRLILILLVGFQVLACRETDNKTSQEENSAPERIICLNGSITETVAALGLESEIVGVDVTSSYPPEISSKPKVGHIQNLSMEGLLSLKPTLIIGLKEEMERGIAGRICGNGVRCMSIPRETNEEGARKFIKTLGDSLGKAAKADSLIQQLNADLTKVVKPDSSLRILFIYARGAGNILVGGSNTPADAMIRMAGGVNVAAELDGYKPLSPEFIAGVNPQVILTISSSLSAVGGEEALLKSIGIKLTDAGKKRHIISMEGLKLLGFGPRLGEGLQELCSLLSAIENGKHSSIEN